MMYYCYLYIDPSRNNEPIYVGKGSGGRAYHHLKLKRVNPFINRLKSMKKIGVEPIIKFLCKDVDEEFAFFCEQEAINWYGRKDLGKGPLLNLTDGGEGSSGVKWSEESKARLRLSQLGKKLSEEHKIKLSVVLKGRVISEEHRAKISKGHMGKTMAQSERLNLSKFRSGRLMSDEQKAKMHLTRIANGTAKKNK